MGVRSPPDQAARHRIREDLQRNLLVEAGAGSGKTTSLIDRMVALVRRGACRVDRIAAVTFTRKAAAELRQKFQEKLEEVAAGLPPEHADLPALETAIRDIDHAFLGTIHSFCARLLRERPLEAGLDPGFREVPETEAERMRRDFWVEFLERLATDGDPRLEELERLGIEPDRLEGCFREMVENPDVDFGFGRVEPPDETEVRAVRMRFDELLDRARLLMRGWDPPDGWDGFGQRVRTLLYWRRSLDWSDQSVFFDALARIHLKKGGLVQKRWADNAAGKARAKELFADCVTFAGKRGPADKVLTDWWAYRYPVAVGVARSAAEAFARLRKERGEINFQDLLVLTAALLRDDPRARDDLGRRYTHILVDEFQDTDPLQAEILLLLASDPEQGDDWREVVPRPGALFVVGDPKQSIYRFRRADIALYEIVKRRFKAFGDVLLLEANFRSLPAVGELVRGVFDREHRFPEEDSDRQASFAPLLTQRDETPGLLAAYRVEGRRQDDIVRDEAERIAAAVARRVGIGDRKPGDFLILTRTRRYLSVYARALEDRNLPVDVSGAGVGFEDELAAFLLLFRCLEDPAHRTRVLGVLTGPLFGITLDRLVAYRDGGGRFAINRPSEGDDEVSDAINVLHGWWRRALREPADVTAERLVRETGLIPLAAAGKLGALRAGALAYLLDAVRARALEGDTSIAGAADALETALDWEDAEAPLVPGRGDCVRVMNLHRAKGLEAPVVFLAAPFGERDWPPRMRVARDGTGAAKGTIPVTVKRGFATEIIAQPATWEADREVERDFEEAEKVRLLYVAATRARDELWIARGDGLPGTSPWEALEEWVAEEAAAGGGGRGPDGGAAARGRAGAGRAGRRDGSGGCAGGDGGRFGAHAPGDLSPGDGDRAGEGYGGDGRSHPRPVRPHRGLRPIRTPPRRRRLRMGQRRPRGPLGRRRGHARRRPRAPGPRPSRRVRAPRRLHRRPHRAADPSRAGRCRARLGRVAPCHGERRAPHRGPLRGQPGGGGGGPGRARGRDRPGLPRERPLGRRGLQDRQRRGPRLRGAGGAVPRPGGPVRGVLGEGDGGGGWGAGPGLHRAGAGGGVVRWGRVAPVVSRD